MEDTLRHREGRAEREEVKGARRKDQEEGGKAHVIYQAMAAASVGAGGLVSAVAMGYTSPALPSMRADPHLHLTESEESWVGAVMPAAALVGSLLAGPLVDTLGRRATILHLTWPFILSWMVVAMAQGVGWLLAGRLLGGVCVGIQAVVGSVFLPEIVHVDLRNILSIFPAIFGNLGLLVSYGAGQALSWRGLAWLGGALCLPTLPLLWALPETPHHLTSTGRPEASLAALRQLRSSAKEAEEEQREISSRISEDKTDVSVVELVRSPNLWPVGVSACLMLAQQTTGITAVVFFASTILEAGGEGMGGKASVLLGVVNFMGTFVGMYGVAKNERRRILRYSSFVVVPALLVLALFFWAQDGGGTMAALASRLYLVPVIALVTYILGFALGWGPVPWVFLGEGLPSRVRGKAAAAVVGVNWGSAFLITKTFGWSVAALGSHTTFLGYALVTAISTVLLLPVMPETYNQSTAQMDQLYLDAAAKKKQ